MDAVSLATAELWLLWPVVEPISKASQASSSVDFEIVVVAMVQRQGVPR
jgi:hypothetical protein